MIIQMVSLSIAVVISLNLCYFFMHIANYQQGIQAMVRVGICYMVNVKEVWLKDCGHERPYQGSGAKEFVGIILNLVVNSIVKR